MEGRSLGVVLVSGHSRFSGGGVGTHLHLLRQCLRDDPEIQSVTVAGVGALGRLHQLLARAWDGILTDDYSATVGFFSRIMLLRWRLAAAVKRMETRPLLIHAHDKASAVAAALVRRGADIRVVQTLHAPFYQQYQWAVCNGQPSLIRTIVRGFDEETAGWPDAYIAVDRMQKRLLLRDFGDQVAGDRVSVIPNAVEPVLGRMRIPLAGRDPRITVARNLYEKNGVEFAIRGFALSEARQRLGMSIFGEGDEGPRLRALAARLGVGDRVEFHGSVARARVLEVLARSALTIVPSIPVGDYVEATSLSMLEALALGVPVIASRVGGLEEVLDGHDAAFLVPPRDPHAIARGIDAIAGRAVAVEDMVERGIRLVSEGYSVPSWYDRTRQVYLSTWGVA